MHQQKSVVTLTLGTLLLLLSISITQAQSGGDYTLNNSTLDSGGGSSSGGDYTLNGTAGQPDAGAATGGDYTLSGGYWSANCNAAPISTFAIAHNNSDVTLTWVGAGSANVYRSLNLPYFTPITPYATNVTSPWTDPAANATGNPAANYTYIVVATNSATVRAPVNI